MTATTVVMLLLMGCGGGFLAGLLGVGGGMELLQFAYFSRRPGAVIGVDVVSEMLDASRENMRTAEEQNDWFKSDFIDLRAGDALHLQENDYLRATSYFAVGGVTQTISAWLSGEIALSPDQLINQLRSMLDAVAGMQHPES